MRHQRKPARSGNNVNRQRSLLDSGPLIGLYNEEDEWHTRCLAFFGETDLEFFTTEAVIIEVIYRIQKENYLAKALSSITSLLNDVATDFYKVHFFGKEDISRIKELRLKYWDQKSLDYADLSLVVAAERLNLSDIITIDNNDFQKLQWHESRHFNVIQPGVNFP
jgi:uncharacterized protein